MVERRGKERWMWRTLWFDRHGMCLRFHKGMSDETGCSQGARPDSCHQAHRWVRWRGMDLSSVWTRGVRAASAQLGISWLASVSLYEVTTQPPSPRPDVFRVELVVHPMVRGSKCLNFCGNLLELSCWEGSGCGFPALRGMRGRCLCVSCVERNKTQLRHPNVF